MSQPTGRRQFLAGLALAAGRAAAQSKPLVIDAHVHVGIGEEMTAPWTTVADVEVTLRHMQEAGIDRSIIFPINNPTYEKRNREVAEICGRYPGKFIGFAKHDPQSEAGRIRKLLTAEVEQLGLKGLKLHKLPTREILDTVAELRIPILYHPETPSNYHMVAQAYPQIQFIMAHIGGTRTWKDHVEGIAVARRYPNVSVDTSAAEFKYIEMAVKELGVEKVIFGSDGPEQDARVELYKVRLLKLAAADEAKILGGNVLRLLPKGSV